jgi:hypothetical protein
LASDLRASSAYFPPSVKPQGRTRSSESACAGGRRRNAEAGSSGAGIPGQRSAAGVCCRGQNLKRGGRTCKTRRAPRRNNTPALLARSGPVVPVRHTGRWRHVD